MTLQASDLSTISRGRITAGTTGTISTTEFTYFAGVAKAMYLDADDPGLPATVYDYCHGLLVLHLYEVIGGHTGFTSENQNGYSYSHPAGTTGWLTEYQRVIDTWNKATARSTMPTTQLDVTRADAVMSAFKLDQAEVPTFFTETD